MTAVLFCGESGDNGLTHYRLALPARGLACLGYTTWVRKVLVQRDDHRIIGWDGPGSMWTPIPKIVVVRHTRDPEGKEQDNSAIFLPARGKGQQVFFDLDDDIWRLPEWNPAAPFFDAKMLRNCEVNMHTASGVLVTTPTLAGQVRSHTDTPVYVCPNAVDVTSYRPHPEHTPLRVGWCGMTEWRIGDLALIADALAEAVKGRDVELWHLGAEPNRLPIDSLWPDGFPVPIVGRPWVTMSQLPRSLAQIDVAVVPLEDIPVNQARSATTGLALAAAGIPFVASPLPAYEELHAKGGCDLASNQEGWAYGLAQLLDATPRQRAVWGAKARTAVAEHYNPKRQAAAWDHAFRVTAK